MLKRHQTTGGDLENYDYKLWACLSQRLFLSRLAMFVRSGSREMKKYYLLFSITVLGVASCATNPGGYKTEGAVEQRLVGMSEAQIATQLGAPTQRVQLTGGGEAWTYRDKAEGLKGGECTVGVVIKRDRVTSASVTARDRSFLSFPLGSCQNLLGNLR